MRARNTLVKTNEEAKELQRKHQEKIDKTFRKKVVKVIEY